MTKVKLLFCLTSKQIQLVKFPFQLLHGFVRNENTFLKVRYYLQLVILQLVFTQFSTSQVLGNVTLLTNIDYNFGEEFFFLKKTNCEFWK